MVDKARLDQMLSNARRYLAVLEDIARIPSNQFLADSHIIGDAKYHFVIAIECCIDVANHVIASEDLRFPKDNAESFAVLCDSGILTEDLREPLRSMARFRNRLVHVYWDIEDGKVYEYLHGSLDDLRRFSQQIAGRFSE